jgi:hypothetical protein
MAGGDYQLVPVPITPGMREDIHRNAAAPPGTLRYASNVRWGAMGAAERRNGTTEIGTTTDPGSQFPVASTYPLEMVNGKAGVTLVGTDGVAFALDSADTRWRFAGRYSSAEPLGKFDFYRNHAGSIAADLTSTVAIDSAGYRFMAYTSTDGVTNYMHYVVQDPDGISIRQDNIGDVRRVRAVSVGAVIYFCSQRYASNEIDVYSITAGGVPTLVTAALVTLDASADSWDVSAWTSTRWAFAALDSSSTTVTVRRMSAGTTEASATQSTNMRATSRITIYGDTSHVWLGWNDNSVSNVARVTCWNWTGAALSSTFTSSTAFTWTATTQTGYGPIIGKGPSATQVRLLGTIHNESGHATPDVFTWRHKLLTTGGTYSKDTTQYHAVPVSKPFGPSGEYVWADLRVRQGPVVTDSPSVIALLRTRTLDNTNPYVIDLVSHVESEAFGGFGDYAANDWWRYAVATPSGTYVFPVRQLTTGAQGVAGAISQNLYYSFREFAINSTLSRRDTTVIASRVQVAGQPCTITTGALQWDVAYNTVFVSVDGLEHGIHRGPTIISATASNSTGSLTVSSSYQYVAVYRWVDADGNIHRSAPGGIVTMTTGASDDTGTLVISTIDFERKFNEAGSIELYRTEAGGSTFFLENDSIANSVGALTVTVTSVSPDTYLAENRILYTQAQQVPHNAPPACRYIRASENRVWLAGLWDPHVVQASKLMVPGEPVQWSSLDTFKVLLPQACTGLAFQDGALLAFSSTSVYAVSTDGGPGNDGLNSFADPRLICPGIGCEQAASILETPIGVIFLSRRGFELIPRGLGNIQSLPGIETTLETYSTISSSTLHVDGRTTTAQFVARSSNGLAVVLVFDLDKSAWSVDTYPVDVVQVSTTADGRLLLASENTSVSPAFLVESSAATDDDNVFYQMKLTFHDIYPFGVFKMGAVHSVYARADAQGTCILNVDIGVDGGSARNCPWTFSGATTFETYREQTPALEQSRGTSIQLSAYDTSSGDAASGVALYGFGLKVADKDSAALLTSAERQ